MCESLPNNSIVINLLARHSGVGRVDDVELSSFVSSLVNFDALFHRVIY